MAGSLKNLVSDLSKGKLSENAFDTQIGADPRSMPDIVRAELELAWAERSPDGVECAMFLAGRLGLSQPMVATLRGLLAEDWHRGHEDVVDALQTPRAPSSVACPYAAALKKHDYLACDASFALAVRCGRALRDIGTEAAVGKLRLLATGENEIVRVNARQRLDALAARRPTDPEPAYRHSRDTRVR